MKNKVGCVIVTYFPDANFLSRLDQTLSQVDEIIIVDNGSKSDTLLNIEEHILKFSKQIKLIKNKNNYGIARALNIGCKYFYDNGFKYSLLLDQDSTITENMVSFLYKTIENINNCAVVGPQIFPKNINSSDIEHKLKYMVHSNTILFKKAFVRNSPLEVIFNITSGSLINLDIWKNIGGFWENLFIEGVDTEYGLRVHINGYSIYIDNNAKLFQEYGNQTEKKIFNKLFFPTNHSPLRYYYLSRNRLKIVKKYGFIYKYYVTWDFMSFLSQLFHILMLENQKLLKIKYICKGLLHGILEKGGCINE